MKRICFIAQFPPPIHGLSKAVETLFNSEISNKYVLSKINITKNHLFFFNYLKVLFNQSDVFYLTLSQSKYGNKRDLLFLKLILFKKKKCVVHLHGGYYRTLIENDVSNKQKLSNYSVLSKVDAAIVLSDCFRQVFDGIVPYEKIYTVPNCVDNEYISSVKQKSNNSGSKRVLYLSNFIPSKGYKDVLDMALFAKNNNLNYTFDFAGTFFDDKDKRYFNDFVKSNQLESTVHYHGTVGGSVKKELLSNSDIFILLTRYPKEGQPISIIEAMANGLAIVSTNHAAIPDMIEDQKNGIIIKSTSSSEEIFNSLDSLDFQRIATTNILTAKEKYSEEKYILSMDEIFEKI